MSISRGYRSEFQPTLRRPFLTTPAHETVLQGVLSRSHETTLDWFSVAERVGLYVDLDSSAHTQGAMLRRRGVPSATNLLCLALLYGPGRMPLRLIAERAERLGIARVSEPALLRRLVNSGDWLEHVAEELIIQQLDGLGTSDAGNDTVSVEALIGQAARERRLRQASEAKRFVLDFTPWSDNLYTDAQVHWLLCVRWIFVSSTIKDGSVSHTEADMQPTAPDRTRMLAHLISAVATRDEQAGN